jgi:hypothetical protein
MTLDEKVDQQAADTVVNAISAFTNPMGHNNGAFCARMKREHRTLQQQFTEICLAWLATCAKMEDYEVDPRNEYQREIARKLLKDIDIHELRVPFI